MNRQQENNAIVNNSVDEIPITQKVSATNHEAPENLDSDYDANDLYEVEKLFLKRQNKILTDVNVRLKTKIKIHMGFEIEMI